MALSKPNCMVTKYSSFEIFLPCCLQGPGCVSRHQDRFRYKPVESASENDCSCLVALATSLLCFLFCLVRRTKLELHGIWQACVHGGAILFTFRDRECAGKCVCVCVREFFFLSHPSWRDAHSSLVSNVC